MNKISNFHSSLFILNECHETIEHLYFEFTNHKNSGSEYYKSNQLIYLKDYIIMEAASFLDEYQIYFTRTKQTSQRPKQIEAEYILRINDLHEVIKPILNTINRWKDLEEYRDNYVAHKNRSNYPIKKLKISYQETYDAPRMFSEIQLLRDLIHMIFGIISQEFKTELIDAFYLGKTLKSVVNPGKDNSNIEEELREMIKTINETPYQKQKKYSLNISELEFFPLQKMTKHFPTFSHPLVQTFSTIRKQKDENK